MSKCDTVIPLIYAMKKRKDCLHIAAETIKKLYDPALPELVEQVCVPEGGREGGRGGRGGREGREGREGGESMFEDAMHSLDHSPILALSHFHAES